MISELKANLHRIQLQYYVNVIKPIYINWLSNQLKKSNYNVENWIHQQTLSSSDTAIFQKEPNQIK